MNILLLLLGQIVIDKNYIIVHFPPPGVPNLVNQLLEQCKPSKDNMAKNIYAKCLCYLSTFCFCLRIDYSATRDRSRSGFGAG